MLITKTPYRISFFGGGTDYPEWYRKNGGAFLSTTIDKYVYLTVRQLPSFSDSNYRIVWSKVETVNKIKHIQHNVVREMLNNFKLKTGMEVHYQGDLPARSGMGSSSSFVVGLMNSLLNIKKKNISKKNLAKKSIYFEQKILNEVVGLQDQISATYGGFNKVDIDKKGNFRIKKIKITNKIQEFNKNLFLIFTGINRTANEIAGQYVSNLKNKEYEMKEISSQVKEGESLLLSNRFDDFGHLLHEGWKLKKSLGKVITNKKIDDLYNFSLKNGALGGKILGAGGGGFMLLYVPKNKILSLKKKLKKITVIPFNFSKTGSEILLNTEK
jgi:D-glycero-alpha-D-manno-heptose-7-phosphate kinase|tara:strand:- start:17671 stop:18651 length:981 start_codon:yes stop_codon:yes gene_type:complete